MIGSKLYSNNPIERLLEGLQVKDESLKNEIEKIKPFYWFGSGNAWVLFLGSSPGGSPPKGMEDKSNYKSEILFSKASNHFENTKDGAGFWEKIVEYSKTLLPNIRTHDLFRLVLAGNLMDTQVGDSSKLVKKDLSKGAFESFKAISIVRPKLLICLQKSVYDLVYNLAKESLCEKTREKDTLIINSGTARNTNYKIPVNYFRSKDELWGNWILTRVPMHPSRSNFCNADNFKNHFLIPIRQMVNEYLSGQLSEVILS